ncbi:curli-like amyloid fiber formation chaperone CsgH [Rhizobium hidalgonense]|uniref:Curli-like amyloid fiber formation chaperone CsgH n=1 Tax=Rhizobium hidalgonense TaxID=1538159 RepID=A0AAJ2GW30_9HYPH|nr:curli-like amyloid fiber formation chaperone CsgH [Rhizobium hidalgonense]MDR9776990.1 curli-like amyloid fiber formation chaperone CsgH [Rhizobium hidalgonense]MDR9823726.1 curli-like amyloid fiber formation chaperone CsgH [Rhizobium hidalgonense]
MPNSIQYPRRLMAILALVLFPVGAVAAMTTASQSEEAQLYEIKATPGAGMVRLDALVRADKHVSGTYTFHVEKSGDGGSRCRSLEKGVGFGALFSFDQRTRAGGPSVAAGLRAAETITTRPRRSGSVRPRQHGHFRNGGSFVAPRAFGATA